MHCRIIEPLDSLMLVGGRFKTVIWNVLFSITIQEVFLGFVMRYFFLGGPVQQ